MPNKKIEAQRTLQESTKLCPMCKERIVKEAVLCRYCNSPLDSTNDADAALEIGPGTTGNTIENRQISFDTLVAKSSFSAPRDFILALVAFVVGWWLLLPRFEIIIYRNWNQLISQLAPPHYLVSFLNSIFLLTLSLSILLGVRWIADRYKQKSIHAAASVAIIMYILGFLLWRIYPSTSIPWFQTLIAAVMLWMLWANNQKWSMINTFVRNPKSVFGIMRSD